MRQLLHFQEQHSPPKRTLSCRRRSQAGVEGLQWVQSFLLLFQGNRFANLVCPRSTSRSTCEIGHILTARQACQKAAWRKHHKYECAMLLATPAISPHNRVLHRLLYIGNHNLMSHETWIALNRLKAHTDQYHSSEVSEKAVADSESATSRTGTALSSTEVFDLYCTVCSLMGNHALCPLTECLGTHKLYGHSSGRGSAAWDKLRHRCITRQSFMRSKCLRPVRRGHALLSISTKASSWRRGHSMLCRFGFGCPAETEHIEVRVLLRLLL